eukprot:TRINITY_DN40794_c0_g1_i1.p1 TRINITY_DN40794_c0_g1~~TRINITY_DN40794_c0_g1_i1.p1  ORF type:complete len:397 (+),score=131.41 TRINITY_DN40794_c0_g1_i1:87-1193(+)
MAHAASGSPGSDGSVPWAGWDALLPPHRQPRAFRRDLPSPPPPRGAGASPPGAAGRPAGPCTAELVSPSRCVPPCPGAPQQQHGLVPVPATPHPADDAQPDLLVQCAAMQAAEARLARRLAAAEQEALDLRRRCADLQTACEVQRARATAAQLELQRTAAALAVAEAARREAEGAAASAAGRCSERLKQAEAGRAASSRALQEQRKQSAVLCAAARRDAEEELRAARGEQSQLRARLAAADARAERRDEARSAALDAARKEAAEWRRRAGGQLTSPPPGAGAGGCELCPRLQRSLVASSAREAQLSGELHRAEAAGEQLRGLLAAAERAAAEREGALRQSLGPPEHWEGLKLVLCAGGLLRCVEADAE